MKTESGDVGRGWALGNVLGNALSLSCLGSWRTDRELLLRGGEGVTLAGVWAGG